MKQRTHFIFFGALFLCLSLLFSALMGRASILLSPVPTDAEICDSRVIILDAGHGGEDGGATGTNGVLEKDLNLAITRTLADLLRGAGYTVVETRTEDKLLYDEGTKKGHKKQGDLNNRLAISEQYPNSIFISLHMNTFPNNSCHGVQVWYSQNHKESELLARAVQEKVKAVMQPMNHRKIKAATSSIFLLRHAVTPAILIECGFLSTPDECEKLSQKDYRSALALTFFSAICENLESDTCEKESPVI